MGRKGYNMRRPIIDKAEVSIDFPDKFYMGAFGRESTFDVTADAEAIHLRLERGGEDGRKVGLHVHHYLLTDLLNAAAEALASVPDLHAHHRRDLSEAAERLKQSLLEA